MPVTLAVCPAACRRHVFDNAPAEGPISDLSEVLPATNGGHNVFQGLHAAAQVSPHRVEAFLVLIVDRVVDEHRAEVLLRS